LGFEGVLFGVAALLTLGVSDFLSARLYRRVGALRAPMYHMAVSALFVGAYVLAFPQPFSAEPLPVFAFLASLAAGTIGILSWYKGMGMAGLSVAAPMISTWAIVPVVLAVLLLGERLTPLHVAGIASALLGVLLVSTRLRKLRGVRVESVKGVDWILAALFGIGLSFFLGKPVVDAWGAILPLFLFRVGAVALYSGFGAATGRDISIPNAAAWPLVTLTGLGYLFGLMFYNMGISTDFVSIVAPVTALSPVVTIALAHWLLGERLELNQYVGVAFALLGVVLLAL
jgi:drug/metabolite transporter (DMT)-like permease